MRWRTADLDRHPLDIRRVHPFWVEDREIEGEVYRRIALDGRIKIGDLKVRCDHGMITLTGTADTPFERKRAAEVARSVVRVAGVDNAITVGVDHPYTKRKRNRALEKLAADSIHTRLDALARHVGIRVWRGVGTLYGQVATAAQERSALEAATQVHGMRDVVSRLRVGQMAPTAEPVTVADNTTLCNWVTSALAEAGITVFDGRIQVTDGLAYLQGKVFTSSERERAAAVAAGIPGIQGVRNLLSVIGTEHSSDLDEDLAGRVMRELAENGTVSLEDVTVVARDGVVFLTGTVDTIADRDVAGRIARRVAGARGVVNDLVVLGRSGPRTSDRRPVLFRQKVGWRRL